MSGGTAGLPLSADPVSYTHLDVYKRQVIMITNSFFLLMKIVLLDYCDSYFIWNLRTYLMTNMN